MNKKITLTLLAFAVALCTFAVKVEKTMKVTVNGKERSYLLYVPNNVKANPALVFSLHGTSGHSSDKQPFATSVADQKGCIVVYPQGEDMVFPAFGNATLPGWHSTGVETADITFFKLIIEQVAESYNIDRERIYCCGFSNGGMMTYTVANVASDVFAAFASISGFPLNEFHLHHTGARPVPFLHIHGKNDDFVKYSLMPNIVDNMVARNGANPVAKKTTVSGKYDKSVYEATEGGFSYTYYEVNGMGHEPSTANTEDGNSSLTMWKHFEKYTLSSECDKTLKWRPNNEQEGWEPKKHGFSINVGLYAFAFNSSSQTDANQNVYRSLQFEKGKYKLCFHTEGDEGAQLTVKLQKVGSSKSLVNTTTTLGGDATIFFDVKDGWGEYKLWIMRASSSVNVSISKLAIYTATQEEQEAYEEATAISQVPFVSTPSYEVFSMAGTRLNSLQKGVNIVKDKDGKVKKVLK